MALQAVEEVVLEPQPGEGDLVLIPMKRSELKFLKVTRFSEAELAKLEKFQEWLATTINPETGQPFLDKNQYSSLIQFCLNTTFNDMRARALEMAQEEGP